jgi:hypothetical protein
MKEANGFACAIGLDCGFKMRPVFGRFVLPTIHASAVCSLPVIDNRLTIYYYLNESENLR